MLGWQLRQVRVGRVYPGLSLGPAGADHPGIEAAALDLGYQLSTGHEGHLVAGVTASRANGNIVLTCP